MLKPVLSLLQPVKKSKDSKCVSYFMTTNGSLINYSMADFFYKYRFKIAISLDGDEKIQNWHRKYRDGKHTFNDVWNNVEILRSAYGTDFIKDIMFLPVIFADENKQTVLDFFTAYGINQSQISFLDANTAGIDYSYAALQSKTIEEIIREEEKGQGIVDDQKDWLLNEYRNKYYIDQTWHHMGPCVPGVHKLFVNTKGDFYPCEKILNHFEVCIGNVYTGIDANRAITLANIGQLTDSECKKCWALRFCRLCLIHCIDEEKCCLSRDTKLLHCESNKRNALQFLKEYIDSINSHGGEKSD